MNFRSCRAYLFTFAVLSFFIQACITSDEYYGVTELYHGRPKPVKMVPRSVLGPHPSGIIPHHTPHSIVVMDSGADYMDESAYSYLSNLQERYMGEGGKGDVPVHYFIDQDGRVYAGCNIISPARIYKRDAFTLRLTEVPRREALLARMKHHNGEPLDLDGYIVVMVLGDYDETLLKKNQEQQMFQLLSNLVYEHKIPREQIYGLRKIYPDIKNPGYYLNNYLQLSTLEKNIPPSPVKHRFMIPPKIQTENS